MSDKNANTELSAVSRALAETQAKLIRQATGTNE